MKNQSPESAQTPKPPPPPSATRTPAPSVSHKAMGIICLFFGIVASVSAVANWAAPAHAPHGGIALARLILSAVLGGSLLVLGMQLARQER